MSEKLKRFCLACSAPLTGSQRNHCSPLCRLKAHRARLRAAADSRRCECCQIPLEASRKLSARFCGDACTKSAKRGTRIPIRKAHQAREHGEGNLTGYRVEEIQTDIARAFILKHEWLGTMPTIVKACFGLLDTDGALVGACVFGAGSRQVHESGSIALERGAILSGQPRNAGSFLISRAVRKARRLYGWRTFTAWADPRAGETGAVYRAAGWVEVESTGGVARTEYRRPDGEPVSERAARRFAKSAGVTVPDLVASGWRRERVPRKRRFVREV